MRTSHKHPATEVRAQKNENVPDDMVTLGLQISMVLIWTTIDQYVLIRFCSKDVLRLFDPWSNFEHVQKLSWIYMDIQVLLRMTTDTIWKAMDQFRLPRMIPVRIRG